MRLRAKYTDVEITLIEQLTYVTKKNFDILGVEKFIGFNEKTIGLSIGKIIEPLISNINLQRIKNISDINYSKGEEWFAIFEYFKNNANLRELILSQVMANPFYKDEALALVFKDKNENQAIVAFQGTASIEEWKDNIRGMFESDTKAQKEAFIFFESLKENEILVTGHSKGANKAKHVTILSEKDVHCVAIDGQGFSQYFLDKYKEKILKRGERIIQYSASKDFIHPLMQDIPNAKQRYIKEQNTSKRNPLGYHSPTKILNISDGKVLLKDGKPYFPPFKEEAENMRIIRELTNFIQDNMSESKWEDLLPKLETLVGIQFVDNNNEEELKKLDISEELKKMLKDGKREEVLSKYFLENEEQIAVIVEYVVKYMKTNNVMSWTMIEVLDTFDFKIGWKEKWKTFLLYIEYSI